MLITIQKTFSIVFSKLWNIIYCLLLYLFTNCISIYQGYSRVTQAFLGTLLTWFLTMLGSAMVFVFSSAHRTVLDGSLGFAAGVMLAASYWSLLAPCIEMTESSGSYGNHTYIPAMIGEKSFVVLVYLCFRVWAQF